jgi:hypothetical protein
MKQLVIFVMGWVVSLHLYARQYQTFEENGKVGMKDEEGHVVIPPSFEALGWSDGNFSVVGEVTGYRMQGLWGIINLKKEFVTKAEYEDLIYSGGESVVARKKINSLFYKAGCVNLHGEIKIPFEYDGLQVQGLRAIVFNLSKSSYRYGLIDINNKIILPIKYKYIKPLGTLRYAVENDDEKIALYNEDGSKVTEFVIDSVSTFYKNYAIVYQDHLQGLIDREGVTKLEVKYRSIKISEDGKVFAQVPNEWSFVSEKNETLKQVFTDEINPLNEKLFYFKKGNRRGILDADLNEVIAPLYESITQIDQGRYLVRANGKAGVIDDRNKTVIPFLLDSLIYSYNSYCAFTHGRGWQLLDINAKNLSSRFYQLLRPLADGNFLVKDKNFYGIISNKGQEIVHCVFDSISTSVANLISVKFRGKYGVINLKEDWLVAPQDFPLQVINEKIYLQKQRDNQFIKTFSGEVKYFTPYKLRFDTENFTETLPNGIEKTIGYDGVIIHRVTPPDNTEEVFHESEGLRGMKKDDRYGFVDSNGKLKIANRYDSIGEFHEGLAAVKLIGKWGFVNTSDRVTINPNYDQPANFENGFAIVSRNKKFGVIDKSGVTVLPFRYDYVQRQTDSFLITISGLKGIADLKGNVAIEPRFDTLTSSGKNLLIACRDGKCGVITGQGLSLIPLTYNQLIFNTSKNVFLAEKKSEWKEIVLN